MVQWIYWLVKYTSETHLWRIFVSLRCMSSLFLSGCVQKWTHFYFECVYQKVWTVKQGDRWRVCLCVDISELTEVLDDVVYGGLKKRIHSFWTHSQHPLGWPFNKIHTVKKQICKGFYIQPLYDLKKRCFHFGNLFLVLISLTVHHLCLHSLSLKMLNLFHLFLIREAEHSRQQ